MQRSRRIAPARTNRSSLKEHGTQKMERAAPGFLWRAGIIPAPAGHSARRRLGGIVLIAAMPGAESAAHPAPASASAAVHATGAALAATTLAFALAAAGAALGARRSLQRDAH